MQVRETVRLPLFKALRLNSRILWRVNIVVNQHVQATASLFHDRLN